MLVIRFVAPSGRQHGRAPRVARTLVRANPVSQHRTSGDVVGVKVCEDIIRRSYRCGTLICPMRIGTRSRRRIAVPAPTFDESARAIAVGRGACEAVPTISPWKSLRPSSVFEITARIPSKKIQTNNHADVQSYPSIDASRENNPFEIS